MSYLVTSLILLKKPILVCITLFIERDIDMLFAFQTILHHVDFRTYNETSIFSNNETTCLR